jgi:proteic killer suppression protein
MIQDFKCKETAKLFERRLSRKLPQAMQKRAYQKLLMLDAARTLEDLTVPPSNRLEMLSGDRKGQHSIRINDQYRICFVWNDGTVNDVEIVDYH